LIFFLFFILAIVRTHLDGVTQPFRPLPTPDYICTLESGAVLYLPPYYFHRVTTISERSIAFNAWSSSLENSHVANQLNHVGQPPNTVPQAIALIHGLLRILNHTHLVADLVRTRYQPLFSTSTFAQCQDEKFHLQRCPSSFIEDAQRPNTTLSIAPLLNALEQKFEILLKYPNEHISNERHARSVAEIIAMDYIERIAMFLFGPNRACTFLRCFIHAT